MRHIFTALLISMFIMPGVANALSCLRPQGKGLIENYEVIFRGTPYKESSQEGFIEKLVKTDHRRQFNSVVTFEVTEVVKGNVGNTMDIHYATRSAFGGGRSFPKGNEYIIFANRSEDGTYYSVGPCTPVIDITQAKEVAQDKSGRKLGNPSLLEIARYQGQKNELDKLISEYGADSYYEEKIRLLEDYHDFEQARTLYEELLGKVYDRKKEWKASKGGGREPGDERSSSEGAECSGVYAELPSTPDFLKPYLAPLSGDIIYGNTKLVVGYARTLFKLGKYQETLRPLCLAQTRWPGLGNDKELAKEADSIKTQALIILGHKEELNGKSIDLSNATIKKIDLSDMVLEHSDFSGSQIHHLTLNNTNLTGANLTGVKWRNVESVNLKLSGANLKDAEIFGKMDGSDLSNVQGQNAFIKADLSGANLEGSDFQDAKIAGTLLNTNLRNTNFEGGQIHSLAGAKMDNTNLNGLSSDYDQFPGKSGDYTNVDLSNFNLSGGRFYERDFSGSRFENTDLSKTDMKGSQFRNANFKNANLSGADFSRGRSNSTDLTGADLSTANLDGINVRDALYDCKTKFPVGFDPNLNLMQNAEGNCINESVQTTPYSLQSFLNPPNHWRLMERGQVSKIKELIGLKSKLECGWGTWDHSHNMGSIDMKGQNLKGRNFSGCMLGYHDFSDSDITDANFKGAYLYSTNFEQAKLTGANFDGAAVTKSTKFPKSFDKSQFKFVPTSVLNAGDSPWQASWQAEGKNYSDIYNPPNYKVPDFPGENLDEINYTAAYLPGSNMDGASLRLTILCGADLRGASFQKADLTGAVLTDALLDNANFTNANMEGADLRWSRMTGTKLEGANLKNALYDNTTEWPKGFDPKAAGAFLVSPAEKTASGLEVKWQE